MSSIENVPIKKKPKKKPRKKFNFGEWFSHQLQHAKIAWGVIFPILVTILGILGYKVVPLEEAKIGEPQPKTTISAPIDTGANK